MRNEYDREDLEGLHTHRARPGDAVDDTNRIAPLGELDDYQVADGVPDVRGWDVLDAGGRNLGKVHELIVDTAEMRTRYLDVVLDHAALGLEDDRHVLIPVGTARLDDDHDHVLLDAATVTRLASLPPFTHGRVTRDYENLLLPALGAAAIGSGAGAYTGNHFDDSRLYANRRPRAEGNEQRVTRSEEELEVGRRAVNAGEVDVTKSVETEHVVQPVTTRREEVTIERRPVSASAASATRPQIGENEIRVPVVEEQVVVEKRPVVKEEIVIAKHAVQDTQTVEADLKKERVEVEDRTRGAAESRGGEDEERRRP